MKSIGWIGVGIMGKPMVRNLQKAGYTLHIYARNREKVADVIQEGAMGTNLSHQGPAGCGQHAKLANQIMIAGTLSGLCEGLRYAQAKGLDGRKLLGALATGAAGSKQMDALGGKILAGDHAPGFFLKHFVKDMTLALGESRDSGLSLEVLGQVLENCRDLEERGLGDLGTQALMVHYRPEE